MTLRKTLKRFKRDVRIKYMFRDDIEEPPGVRYIPDLYIKNDDWKPPPASAKVETCLSNFEEELRRRQSSYQNKTTLSNLTPRQWKLSQRMLYDDDLIVIECDKNLGELAWTEQSIIQKESGNTLGIPTCINN